MRLPTARRRLAAPVLASVLVAVLLASALLVAGPAPAPGAQPPPIDWDDPVPPAGTARLGDAPADTDVDVFFGFGGDQDGLEARATAVSDPSSPTYGDHLPVAELAARFGVASADRAAFEAGVVATGAIPAVDATGAFATPTLSVAQLEELLDVSFGLYEVVEGSDTFEVIAPDALPDPVPSALSGVALVRGLDHVVPAPPGPTPPAPPAPPAPAVTPVTDVPVDGGTPWRTGTAAGCEAALALTAPPFGTKGLAPNQLQQAYGIDALHQTGLRGDGVRIAFVEAGAFQQSDLDAYQACFGIDATTPIVHGSQPANTAGVEASLDLQAMAVVAPHAERIDVFLNPWDESWQLAPFLSAPLDVEATGGHAPHVVSVSYAECELTYDDAGLIGVIERVLATAAAAGVGYYVAAGDSGSSGCFHNDGITTSQSAAYPATSAWVTAVGGTNLTLTEGNGIAGQGVWNDLTYFEPPAPSSALAGGGGGPSTAIDRPDWQAGSGVGSGSMRLTPDVALFADAAPGWIIYCTIPDTGFCPDTGWVTVGGTSAATPLMAGIATLATQALLEAGRPPLGFATPLLYDLAGDPTTASVFFDVVEGGNDLFAVGCCTAGVGFDQASGWGSPDARRLVQALVPVDPPVTTTTAAPTSSTAKAPSKVVTPRYAG
jgi:subtilase family serine protease